MGALLSGADPLSVDERRDLLDEYNARATDGASSNSRGDTQGAQNVSSTTRNPAPSKAERALATLRIAPLLADQSHGVALGMSF